MVINIDKDLLREALELSNERSESEVVNEALAEFIRSRKQHRMLELFGTIDFNLDYDYKAERRS